MSTGMPSVLFVCVRNGGKSQMAAGLMKKEAGDLIDAHSAGTDPREAINQLSKQTLREAGADISGEHSKPIDLDLLRTVDRVIVLGRDAKIDPVDGVQIEYWDTDEPSERGIERMRLVRDDNSPPT